MQLPLEKTKRVISLLSDIQTLSSVSTQKYISFEKGSILDLTLLKFSIEHISAIYAQVLEVLNNEISPMGATNDTTTSFKNRKTRTTPKSGVNSISDFEAVQRGQLTTDKKTAGTKRPLDSDEQDEDDIEVIDISENQNGGIPNLGRQRPPGQLGDLEMDMEFKVSNAEYNLNFSQFILKKVAKLMKEVKKYIRVVSNNPEQGYIRDMVQDNLINLAE